MQTHSRYRKLRSRPKSTDGILHRFFGENMLQTSAALALETLLALVPLIAVILSVAQLVPFLDTLVLRLDQLIREALLPAGASRTIANSISRFSHQAQQLTVAGIAFLSITAFLLMNTIERALNQLWRVQPRPWAARIRLYAFVMAIWPFVLGAVGVAMSYAVTFSLGLFNETMGFRQMAFKAVSLVLLGLFFSFLYYAVPNAKVSGRAAVSGGIFATLGFSAMQKIFEMFLVSSSTLKSIYGAFAAFPVFLLWLQFSWAIVLLGGLVAARLSRPESS